MRARGRHRARFPYSKTFLSFFFFLNETLYFFISYIILYYYNYIIYIYITRRLLLTTRTKIIRSFIIHNFSPPSHRDYNILSGQNDLHVKTLRITSTGSDRFIYLFFSNSHDWKRAQWLSLQRPVQFSVQHQFKCTISLKRFTTRIM